jgi:hypothetical protein
MARSFLPRALGAAAIVAGLVAALTLFAGSGLAVSGTAAQANYAPQNTAAPTVSGTPEVGQTLTASNGTFTSDTTPTYTYQWRGCDAQGNNCASITGATSQTYAVQSADVGKTLRVVVTATNASGASSATSAQTAVVTTAVVKTPVGVTTVQASNVVLPNRLTITGVKFSPSRLVNRAAFTGRFRVTDNQGLAVQGALVKVTALPYSWARGGAEVTTDQTGWATVTISPTINLPLQRNALVMFLRARVQGQPLLAGASTRRLVQITIR